MARPYAFLKLGASLSLDGGVLNSSVDLHIGGVPCRVLTPSAEWVEDRRFVLVCPSAAGSWSASKTATAPLEEPWLGFWGNAHGWHPDRRVVTQWTANHVLIELTEEAANEAAALACVEPLLDALPEWNARLLSWLAVMSGQLAAPGIDQATITGPYEAAGAWWDDDNRAHRLQRTGMQTILVRSTPGITRAMWERSAVRAAVADEPPIEWMMLIEADRAFAQQRYRQAVVDAATAVEVVLRTRVEGDLRSLPCSLTRRLVPEKATLGALVQIYSSTREPDQDLHHLVDLRNKVVHRSALEPTATDAARAIGTAGGLVGWLSNRPSPG